MMSWMVLFAVLFSSPPTIGRGSAQDFSRSYALWVSVEKGECLYWLTDVGLDATQLTVALKGYQSQLGVEILTSRDTPHECVADAEKAAMDAGFQLIRDRPATEKDRLRGIP
jgi:hypothetical protein